MERRFSVNLSRLVEQLLPLGMRSRSVLALLRAGLWPIMAPETGLLAKFEAKRDDFLFELRHNGQVCYLRAALNAKFKSGLGVLFDIVESQGKAEWVFASTESTATRHIHAISEYKVPNVESRSHLLAPDEVRLEDKRSFTVLVPHDLFYNDNQLNKIKQFVNKYRLVSRAPRYEPSNS